MMTGLKRWESLFAEVSANQSSQSNQPGSQGEKQAWFRKRCSSENMGLCGSVRSKGKCQDHTASQVAHGCYSFRLVLSQFVFQFFPNSLTVKNPRLEPCLEGLTKQRHPQNRASQDCSRVQLFA